MATITEQSETPMNSKRPAESAFKQQRLPAWQPILTAGTVLPTFFIIGIAFIPVGIGLLYFSDEVKEFTYDYTDCLNVDDSLGLQGKKCAEVIALDKNNYCKCSHDFILDKDFDGKVFMYYGLTNFYQNHRRYVKSRDDNQLLGTLDLKPSSDCSPFAYGGDPPKPVAPCGAIANSLFSDELTIFSVRHKKNVPLLKTGIAWPSDKEIKFSNPAGNLTEAFKNFIKPESWSKNVYELDKENASNNGFENEELIVWMRTAALPTFRKLYRRVDHQAQGFVSGLLQGNYTLNVVYSYPVTSFEGTKRMILSTTSLLGGKNPFLGVAYIVVGSVCLLLGVVFLFIHIKCGKSTNEMIDVSPRTPYQ